MRILLLSFFLLCSAACISSCERVHGSWQRLQAETAYNQQNYQKAIEIYRKLIKTSPGDGTLHWKLGIAYYSNGDLDRARTQIKELKKHGRDDLANDLSQLFEK